MQVCKIYLIWIKKQNRPSMDPVLFGQQSKNVIRISVHVEDKSRNRNQGDNTEHNVLLGHFHAVGGSGQRSFCLSHVIILLLMQKLLLNSDYYTEMEKGSYCMLK